MKKLLKVWNKLSKGKKVFVIYSLIVMGILLHATKYINVVDGDVALGVVISWLMYMVAYIFYLWIILLDHKS
jgi:uncharacterized membrane protein YecN with MAPEG domain